MKFGSLITPLKQTFMKGAVVSFLCISNIAEATIYTVTSTLDDNSAGTFRSAMALANGDPGSTINFTGLAPNAVINITANLPNIANAMTIDTSTPAGLSILAGLPTFNNLYTVLAGSVLTLQGNMSSNNGNMVNSGVLNLVGNGGFRSISGTGVMNSTAVGGNILYISLNGGFFGPTNLISGVTGINSIGPMLPPSDFTIQSAATLSLVGSVGQPQPEGAGGINGSGALILGNNPLRMGVNNSNSTFSGTITGNGNFIKYGTGYFELSGSKAATGQTTINDGTYRVLPNGILGGPVSITSLAGPTLPILEMNGGTNTGVITGDGTANSKLLVTGAYTPTAAITNVGNITVGSGGIFTMNVVPTGSSTFAVQNGGTAVLNAPLVLVPGGTLANAGEFFLNSNITGNVTNTETITHTANATRTIIGNFNNTSGNLNVGITSSVAGQYSRFTVTGSATLNGGVVQVSFPNGTSLIDGGEVFNILASVGPIINNGLPTVTVPTVSLFLDFTPTIFGNTLRLTANRTTYEAVNQNPILDPLAAELDSQITNPNFNTLLVALDGVTDQATYETDLAQLAPYGLNESVVAPTMQAQAAPIDRIFGRLEAMRTSNGFASISTTGYAAGDMLENQASYGPILFGNTAKQGTRNGLPGYNAFTAGFGLTVDVPILEYYRVGIGASYGSTAVKQADNSGSNTTIGSTQGLAYGSATYGPLFLDAVLSAGFNNYHQKRNITFLAQTAASAYTGFQYGAKVKAGFSLPCYQLELSPMGTLQYMHLNLGQYTEQGAPGSNLSVSSTQINAVRAGIGGRIADTSQEEEFFPEIHAFYIVDTKAPNLQITSRFVNGGGSFVSTGAVPPRSGVNIGGSISALVSDNLVITGAYDLEAKKSFTAHSLALKFRMLF